MSPLWHHLAKDRPTGHTISLDTPLRMREIEPNVHGCSGYPGDCVMMGLGHICKDNKPDLVIAGINRGANLGQDLYYSGTVAAAREASFHGVPSIAISLAADELTEDYHWESACHVIKELLKENIHQMIPELSLININVPNLPLKEIKGMKFTSIGFRDYSENVEERVDTRKRKYYWVAGSFRGHYDFEGSDCMAIDQKYVAVTPHQLINSVERNFQEVEGIVRQITLP
jgi:5'-nucleotidase